MTIFFKGFYALAMHGLVSWMAFVPLATSAWLFSSAHAESPAKTETGQKVALSDHNSQNMMLLASAVAMISDRKPDNGANITIVDDEALSPEIGPTGTLADKIDIPANDLISVYVVVPGDTVSAVAKRFGVSESTVRWANNLKKTDVLHVGQKIVILPITGVKHTVASGDTLDTIAKKYKADKEEIASYNGLEGTDKIFAGDIIIVPDGEISTTPVTSIAKKSQGAAGAALKSGSPAPKGYYGRPITLTGNPRIRKTQGFHDGYNAIDVGAPTGTPILAMADGTVIVTKSPQYYNGGYGGLSIIQHGNGTQTVYAHQSRIIVTVGQSVSKGEKIGEVGSTGRSTGPHLHYEIRGVRPTPVLY